MYVHVISVQLVELHTMRDKCVELLCSKIGFLSGLETPPPPFTPRQC